MPDKVVRWEHLIDEGNVRNLFAEAQQFLDEHTDLLNYEAVRRNSEFAGVASELHRRLNTTGKALIRYRGNVAHLGRITSLCEKLGLIVKGKEFATERRLIDHCSFDPCLTYDNLEVYNALAIRATLYVVEGAKDQQTREVAGYTDNLLLQINRSRIPVIPYIHNWMYDISEREMEDGFFRVGFRPEKVRKKMEGVVWRGHREYHYALERAAVYKSFRKFGELECFSILADLNFGKLAKQGMTPIFFKGGDMMQLDAPGLFREKIEKAIPTIARLIFDHYARRS